MRIFTDRSWKKCSKQFRACVQFLHALVLLIFFFYFSFCCPVIRSHCCIFKSNTKDKMSNTRGYKCKTFVQYQYAYNLSVRCISDVLAFAFSSQWQQNTAFFCTIFILKVVWAIVNCRAERIVYILVRSISAIDFTNRREWKWEISKKSDIARPTLVARAKSTNFGTNFSFILSNWAHFNFMNLRLANHAIFMETFVKQALNGIRFSVSCL